MIHTVRIFLLTPLELRVYHKIKSVSLGGIFNEKMLYRYGGLADSRKYIVCRRSRRHECEWTSLITGIELS
jgi:hypothetical protein